jgi:hypothetical protein
MDNELVINKADEGNCTVVDVPSVKIGYMRMLQTYAETSRNKFGIAWRKHCIDEKLTTAHILSHNTCG